MLINSKLKTGGGGKKQLTGISPFRGLKSASDCTAICEKYEKEEICYKFFKLHVFGLWIFEHRIINLLIVIYFDLTLPSGAPCEK
jgi:hypothetical protein